MVKKIFASSTFFLIIILLLAFGLRLYKIDRPLADHHSWRQADTAAVARNFVKEGYDFLKPKIDNISPTSSTIGKLLRENKQRLFLTEAPIYNSIIFLFYKFFGVRESLARLTTILFSLTSVIFLFLIAKRLVGIRTALLASLFMAVLPYSIFFSTVILPEPIMVSFSLVGIYFMLRFVKDESLFNLILASIFISLAVLVKIFAVFLGLPILYLFFKKYRWAFFKSYQFYLFGLIVLLPIIFWRLWISQFPEGIPGTEWLFNSNQIRFRPAFFYWLVSERIDKLILTAPIFAFFVIGLVLRPKKEGLFLYFWLSAILIYFTIFATGNVTHDYYQLIFLPIGVIFAAKGANYLLALPKDKFIHWLGVIIVIVSIPLAFILGWFQTKDFYNPKSGVDLAGIAIDQLTPKDSLVIAGDGADVSLLYNTNRHGWTVGYASHYTDDVETVEGLRRKGATFYVTTKVNEIKNTAIFEHLINNYQIIDETNQYVIFDLR